VALIVGSVLLLVYSEAIPLWKPVERYELDLLFLEKDIFIHATVSSTEPEFADRVPITTHAYGSIGNESNIFIICLCFSGAYFIVNNQVETNINKQPFAGVLLNITHTRPNENLMETFEPGAYLAGIDQTIEWLSPTESVPYIIITYTTFTPLNGLLQQDFASQGYPAKSLHIESYSMIESEKTSLKSNATDIGIVGLALAEFGLYVIPKRQQREPKIN
jgi:hypothetical protein